MIHTSGFVASRYVGGSWVDVTDYVMQVSGDFSSSGQGSGFLFGDSSEQRSSIQIDPRAKSPTLDLSAWAMMPWDVEFTVDSNTDRGVAGIAIDVSEDQDTATYTIVGWKQLISTVRVYSDLFYRRPIATATTASSIENPATGGYAAGLLNWIMWQAGGRPYEQSGTYPAATFYYSFSQAPIAPRYSWVCGEDGWAEAIRLVRAAGGQLYQRPDGVIAYANPLSFAGGAAVFALGLDDYGSVVRRGDASPVVSSFSCEYVPRFPGGLQVVLDDSSPRVVADGQTIIVEKVLQYPILTGTLETASGGGTQLLPEAISATSFDGTQVEQGTDYTHTIEVSAQRVVITIENVSGLPFVIERITLRANPLLPGEAGTVTVGSGNPTQTIEQNPLVQSRSHAQRLARQALAYYGLARPVITAAGVVYDPTNHQIGNAGTLTIAEWGLSSAAVVLTGVKMSETGTTADLDLVETAGLPALSEYWLVASGAQSGTKKIGY